MRVEAEQPGPAFGYKIHEGAVVEVTARAVSQATAHGVDGAYLVSLEPFSLTIPPSVDHAAVAVPESTGGGCYGGSTVTDSYLSTVVVHHSQDLGSTRLESFGLLNACRSYRRAPQHSSSPRR
jgi:hypothetical protein